MKKFMFLHFGFEKPTPEIMKAWQAWFESISDRQVDQGGFSGGYHGVWNPLLVTTSSRRRVLMLLRNLPKAIHSLRAFESTN